MTEGHGDDIYRYGDRVKLNFSTNIPDGADHPALMAHLATCGHLLSHYPEPTPRSLEICIASTIGVAEENVMVTNGATEAIYVIARILCAGVPSAVMAPAFAEYADACYSARSRVMHFNDVDRLPSGASVVWICNPANPTGQLIDRKVLLDLIHRKGEQLVIIDQAYKDYTDGAQIGPSDITPETRLLLIRSLTKRFRVPGLRLGYIIGPASLISRLKRHRHPWSLGSLQTEAAAYLIRHVDDYELDTLSMHSAIMNLRRQLEDTGISVEPSDCNFMLCRLHKGTAASLKEYLVTEHGMLIRDASNFHGLTPAHFRVATQGEEADSKLVKAIRLWLGSF